MDFTIQQVNPEILSACGTQNIPLDFQNTDMPLRSYCLLYAVGGGFEVSWEQKSFSVPENCAFFFLPDHLYTVQSSNKKIQLIDVRFDLLPQGSGPQSSSERSPAKAKEKQSKAIYFSDYEALNEPLVLSLSPQNKRVLEGVLWEQQKNLLFSKDISNLYLRSILLSLIRDTFHREEKPISDAASKIMRYVHVHITENIQNELAAKELSYHPNYINRVIKKATGMTFHKYVIDEKLHYATSLLLSTNDSITDIAYTLAFNTSSHFSNLFAEKYKCTPSQYRKRRF